jgi:hypothetical protein
VVGGQDLVAAVDAQVGNADAQQRFRLIGVARLNDLDELSGALIRVRPYVKLQP